MAEGKTGGTAFMEDYTYNLVPGPWPSLGPYMLEVCPSVAPLPGSAGTGGSHPPPGGQASVRHRQPGGQPTAARVEPILPMPHASGPRQCGRLCLI